MYIAFGPSPSTCRTMMSLVIIWSHWLIGES
jgi:hypothetical protein